MDAPRTPDDWYELGQSIYQDVMAALRRYGVRVHPDLRLIKTDAPTPYYEPDTMTIGFGFPDPITPKGRLYTYLVQHLVGAADVAETQQAMEVPLPWSIAHEIVHHLRHYYGAPIANDFIEEQVVNCVAIALLDDLPQYRDGLPTLKRWADRVFERARSLSPATSSYLAGFRLDVVEVLVAQGAITRKELSNAQGLASISRATSVDILARTGRITPAQIERARSERESAEEYFNRRYMAGLGEYWLFGAEWLARYLERNDLPSFGEALERYILTADWELSRQEATLLFLQQALRSEDSVISTAAVDELAVFAGESAVDSLVAVLNDSRPTVQSAALRMLGKLPNGPAAAAASARLLLTADDDVRGAAARLLRLAGLLVPTPTDAPPAQLAEAALALLPEHPKAAYSRLEGLLMSDEAAAIEALKALSEAGPGPLVDRVIALLDSPSPTIRASTARALGTSPEATTKLVALIGDEDPGVRSAIWESVAQLGSTAWPALISFAESASDALRVEALSLVDSNSMPEAALRLTELAASLRRRALQLKRIEARLAAHTGLALLALAAGDERRRFARLSFRAYGRVVDPEALDLTERALASPDPQHRASARDFIRASFGCRGRVVAELLTESTSPANPESSVLAGLEASARAEPALLRALTAYLAPQLLPEEQADSLLRLLASDGELFVRMEAESSLLRMRSPAESPMLTSIEKLIFLRAVPTFADCEIDLLRRVSERFIVQRFEPGEVILHEGDPGQHFYLVAEGQIAITAGGRTIDELGPRQSFGEMALFDGRPRSATATAIEATTLLRLDRDDFYRLGREWPDLLIGVIRILSERLRTQMAQANSQPTEVQHFLN